MACPKTTMMICSITSMLRKLWSVDEFVHKLHWDHLKSVASRFYKVESATDEQVADFLSSKDSTSSSGSRYTMFTRFRQAVKHLSKENASPLNNLKVVIEKGELSLVVRSHAGSETAKYGEGSRKTLNKLLKEKVEDAVFHRFTTSKRAGKLVQALARDRRNNTFVKDGGWLSHSGHNFIHKARLDLMHLNASVAKARSTNVRSCRRCGKTEETMLHVQQCCQFQLGTTITDRHDAVLARLVHSAKQGSRKNWEFRVDKKGSLDMKRPDLVLLSEAEKEVVIVDVCCPFELGEEAMVKAHNEKVRKYSALKQSYESRGFKAQLLPVVVGSFGSWRPENDTALRALGISRAYSRKMIELITATVIEHSKNIYWKHIHGDKYRIIPNFLPIVEPKGANWTDRLEGSNHDPPPLHNSEDEM